MIDRCRTQNCRQGTPYRRSSMNAPMPSCNRQTPDCRGRIREEQHNHPYPNDMIKRLQALDFSIVDTVLYLDAYPHCQKALDFYHELIAEREELVRILETQYHTPITSFGNCAVDHWDWTAGPWPWELGANG